MLYTETCMCVIRTQTVCVVECECFMFTNTNEMHATWHQYQCTACRDFNSCLHSVLDERQYERCNDNSQKRSGDNFELHSTALYSMCVCVCWICRLLLSYYTVMCGSGLATLCLRMHVCLCPYACVCGSVKTVFLFVEHLKQVWLETFTIENRKVLTTKRSGRLFITRVSLD